MENAEGILQALEEYVKLKPNDIPSELNDYLTHVAKTGDPVFQWSVVKYLFRDKLAKTITEFYESSPAIDLPPCPNVDAFNYEVLKNSLLERLDSFSSAPFTVQRICELLINPRKEYSRVDKYMRAIEKNILVVSTKEPGIPKRPESVQSEPVMNGVVDSRGIELGEAIETVSSDGVNLMHGDSSDVSVPESVRLLDCSTTEGLDMEERTSRPLANIKPWQKNQASVVLVTANGESKNYDAKDQENPPIAEKLIENIELSNIDSTKSSTLPEPDTTAESVVDSFNQVIVNEVAEQVCSPKNESIFLQEAAEKAVFEINLSEIAPNKSPGETDSSIPTELESTTENIVSEAIAIVEEDIQKDCESDESVAVSTMISEVPVTTDHLQSTTEPILESTTDTLDKSAYETSPSLGTVIIRDDLTESLPGKEIEETCSITVTEIVSTQEEIPENLESGVESQIVHKQDIQSFVEESDASVSVDSVKVVEDSGELPTSEQALAEVHLASEHIAVQEDSESVVALPSTAMVGGLIEENLCTENNDMEPVEVESAIEQDEAMDIDDTSLPMEVATEEEPMDQSEEMPGGGSGS